MSAMVGAPEVDLEAPQEALVVALEVMVAHP